MQIEYQNHPDGRDVLIRVAPDVHEKVAAALGERADDLNVPGGWTYGLWPRAIERVAAMNPRPAGPEMNVYPTIAEQMRRALGLPLGDATPAHELARRIIEKLTGAKLTVKQAAPDEAAKMRALALSGGGGQCVLSLSGDGRSPAADMPGDRQAELLRQMTRAREPGRAPAMVLVLSADGAKPNAIEALALSGDRQAELLCEATADGDGATEDRQAELLRQQVAGTV